MNWRNLVIGLFCQPASALSLNDLEWQSVIFILRENGLLASYAALLQQQALFEPLSEYPKKHLESALVAQKRLEKQAIYEAQQLHLELTKNRFQPPIFLKGVGYALSANAAAAGRLYSDVDVLVSRNELGDIERLLLFKGWMQKEVSDYDDKYYRLWAHEIPPMLHALTGTVIDVHHNLVPLISGRAPDVSLFYLARRRLNNGCYVLSRPAMLLHSIVHLYVNEDFTNGFRDLLDQRALYTELDADERLELAALAAKTGFSRELYYALRYLRLVLGVRAVDQMEVKEKPSKLTLVFMDYCFLQALTPNHRLTASFNKAIAVFLLYCRGHFQKMPMATLFSHTLVKSWLSLRKKLFGETAFEKQQG